MKLSDVPPDILFRPIAEKIQFGPIGAQDSAVAADQVQGNGAVLEKIFQVLLLVQQEFFVE
jgi:hypothetical protein